MDGIELLRGGKERRDQSTFSTTEKTIILGWQLLGTFLDSFGS